MSTLIAILLVSTPLAVVTDVIPRGGKVDRSNVELVDTSEVQVPRMLQPHEWRDSERLRARRALRAGTIVSRFDVEPMPDVAAGDSVIVEIVRGNVRVTATAIAKQDGFAGEAIWVENDTSKRRIRVRVVEAGRVALELPGRRE